VRDGCFHQSHGASLVFSVTPAKVLAFAKGTFGATRHRFEPDSRTDGGPPGAGD
jgi:hypothetical protein